MDFAFKVGRSFLSSLLQALGDRITQTLTDQIFQKSLNLFRKGKYDIDPILEKLKGKLLILQAVLEDAEDKQSKNKAVIKWLDELQEVVYQAEDLLDQINTEALRVEVESQFPREKRQKVESQHGSPANQVSASIDPSNFEFLKDIMPQLEEILRKLEDFEQNLSIRGLMKEVESKKPFARPSSSVVAEHGVYGRDADRDTIVQKLLSNSANGDVRFSVIPIVGLGGIGKTTLAQHVYTDDKVKKHFDSKLWVCVSEEYDDMRITRLLLNELNISSSDSNESFNSLQVKLKQGLSNKRFLLVLDDVWNRSYNDWSALSAPFNGGNEGSWVIVTTRDEKVALMMGNQHRHRLNRMSDEDCWNLFKKHIALNSRDPTANSEFEWTGKGIVKKCDGLPLAVKSIAGLLRSKESIDEWNEILKSDEWDQATNEAGIFPSLRLSYTHLSPRLKRCFAYCAVFHKDYLFSKDEVIFFWMAHDLLEEDPRSNKRPEDMGDEFFRDLQSRSFFEQSRFGKFSMHDLVNDLAKLISGRKYFLRLEDHQQHKDSSSAVRHFSYLSNHVDKFEKFKPVNESKFLRTFLPLKFRGNAWSGMNRLSQKLLIDILPVFKSLRVLSLYGYKITELPDSFGNLKQLRFLNLSYTKIKKLPFWICTFCKLRILLLVGCEYLEEFPKDMDKLINLRHLDIRGVPLGKMSMGIGRLKELHFLGGATFIVSKDSGSKIEDLGKLCNLQGEFRIWRLENVANGENASMAKMSSKEHIKKLTLKWMGDTGDTQLAQDVLENLQPHSNVVDLEINGYCGTRFPNWLGQLPSLKCLTIKSLSKVSKIGQEFYGNICLAKPFPCLKVLRIENMCELREWHLSESDVFSSLEELYIVNCPKLIGEIPKQLPSLRIFEICKCPGLVNFDGELTIFESKTDVLHGQLCSLRELRISKMPNLKQLLPSSSSSSSDLNKLLPVLQKLWIYECENIVSFPIDRFPTTLKELSMGHCEKLGLETHEMTPTCHASIESLHISGNSIKNLSLDSFPALRSLYIGTYRVANPRGGRNPTAEYHAGGRCDNFMSFTVGGLPAPNLTYISLSRCPKLKSLPEKMHTLLPSLRRLELRACPEIECFPDGGLPSSLQSLEISECKRLWSCRREWGLQRLPSLTDLSITASDHEGNTLLPQDLLLPFTLRYLNLESFPNSETLNGGVLQHLTCLQSLSIYRWPKLKSLPEEKLPTSLSQLYIYGCPLLKQRLQCVREKEWPKVEHIAYITVDGEVISEVIP